MLDKSLSAPVSARGLFAGSSSDEEDGFQNEAQESRIELAGFPLRVLERPFHPLNANAVWPGTYVLAEWVRDNLQLLEGRRLLELGSATGALAVFLVAGHGLDVTTSDVDDDEVEQAIAATFALNGRPPPPHMPHTWGAELHGAPFDVILASDILLYCKAYPALVDTLSVLCAPSQGRVGAVFYMSWQRRLPESAEFFEMLRRRGFSCEHLGPLIYEIRLAPAEMD